MDQSRVGPDFEEAVRRLLFQDRSEKYLVPGEIVADLSYSGTTLSCETQDLALLARQVRSILPS